MFDPLARKVVKFYARSSCAKGRGVTLLFGQCFRLRFPLELAVCGEMDLIVLRWEGWFEDAQCPEAEHLITECESDVGTGNSSSVSVFQTVESHYMVIVESPEAAEELFELSVDCEY